MATIIDSLVITLGLNAQPMQTGQAQALQSLRNFIGSLHQQAQQAQGAANGITAAFGRMKLGMLGLAGLAVGAAAGFFELEKKLTASDAQLAHTARTLGMNATALGNWQSTAKAAGGSADGVTAAFGSLASQLTHMQFTGVPPEAINWLASLGVGIRDARGDMKSMDKVFVDLSENLRRRGYTIQQAGVVFSEVFGGQADSLLKIEDRARRAGMSVDQYQRHIDQMSGRTSEAITRHERLMDKWNEMGLKAEGLGRKIEEALGPTFEHMEDRISHLITRMGELVESIQKNGIAASIRLFDPGSPADNVLKFLEKGIEQWAKVLGISSAEGSTPPAGAPAAAGEPLGGSRVGPAGSTAPPLGAPVNVSRAPGAGWWTPDRINYAVDYLKRNAGLTDLGARALVARMAAVESAGRGPNDVNPTSGAVGIAQWLGDRKRAGVPTDFEGQLGKVAQELNSSEARAKAMLNSARTAEEAARGASQFERAEDYNPATGADAHVRATIQQLERTRPAEAPQVDTGAAGASQSSPSSIDNSQWHSSSISSSNHVSIANMQVTTPDPDDFAKQMKPVLEAHMQAIPADSGLG